MIISEGNSYYRVNNPEGLLKNSDNDSLIEIMKSTYLNKCINEDISNLVKNGLLIGETEDEEFNPTEWNEGVTFLKAALSERLSTEIVDSILTEVDDTLTKLRKGIKDKQNEQ